MVKVSVIIPSYNRFNCLLEAIDSVMVQTMQDFEIIVINDKSIQEDYYSFDFNKKYGDKIKIIHLEKNSSKIFGHASAGYTRTVGMKEATGEYIAFLDDDDIWFPSKLENQMNAMVNFGCHMSSTEGLHGNRNERYNKNKKYLKFNSEKHFTALVKIYRDKKVDISKGFPKIWNKEFLEIHNCMIASSVIVKKTILENIGYMKNLPNGKEDCDCWRRCLEHTDSVYLDDDVYFFYASLADHDGKYKY
tara:strand:+ start:612 stop:1352 length:741 start_codon:yes stop_codon:yes gene_type:complete